MFNILKIFIKNQCSHSKVSPNVESGYCPDCGEYVENHWFLIRCKHCKIKRKAHLIGGNPAPETRFCPNCGGFLYEVEKLEKINFIDINFAVLKKEVVNIVKNFVSATTWVEETNDASETVQKLIGVKT